MLARGARRLGRRRAPRRGARSAAQHRRLDARAVRRDARTVRGDARAVRRRAIGRRGRRVASRRAARAWSGPLWRVLRVRRCAAAAAGPCGCPVAGTRVRAGARFAGAGCLPRAAAAATAAAAAATAAPAGPSAAAAAAAAAALCRFSYNGQGVLRIAGGHCN